MKLIKDGNIVDFVNQGTIDAYKASGYVEYKEPAQESTTKATKKTSNNE